MNESLSLLNIALTLFLIMDPIGNIQSFLNLMKDTDPARRKKVILREMLIALAAMVLFNYIGEFLFNFLEISETAVRLSSGVILFLVAIRILFSSSSNIRANLPTGEPFIIPLAVPLIAGPSLLATIMLYAHMDTCEPLMLVAIILAWIAAFVVLVLAPHLNRFLGKNGLGALERLMGMVLVMLAIQRFMEGVEMLSALRP